MTKKSVISTKKEFFVWFEGYFIPYRGGKTRGRTSNWIS